MHRLTLLILSIQSSDRKNYESFDPFCEIKGAIMYVQTLVVSLEEHNKNLTE